MTELVQNWSSGEVNTLIEKRADHPQTQMGKKLEIGDWSPLNQQQDLSQI